MPPSIPVLRGFAPFFPVVIATLQLENDGSNVIAIRVAQLPLLIKFTTELPSNVKRPLSDSGPLSDLIDNVRAALLFWRTNGRPALLT